MMPAQRAAFRRPAGAAGLAVLGLAWLALAAGFAYFAVATPFLDRLVLDGRLSWTGEQGRLVAIALLAAVPVGFATAGAVRLSAAVRAAGRRGRTAARRLAVELAPDLIGLGPIRIDGMTIEDVVVGRHGLAVFHELPSDAPVRRSDGRWEIGVAGAWVAFENPLDRTAREADALRHFLAAQQLDFVVRVNAAVVTNAGDLERVAGCAVVRPDRIGAYLAALPAQRSLNVDRIAAIVRTLRAVH